MNQYALKNSYKYSESGFTLLELMVALVLGLIISAAALQLFLISQKNITTQQALLNMQSDSLFGLEALVRDIRLANLNANQPYVDDSVLHGGIILNGKNYTNIRKVAPNQEEANINLINALSVGEVGGSNLKDQKSDQLVIQYLVKVPNQFDCEGRSLIEGNYVVERFFLREDVSRNDPNKALALACKAQSYTEYQAQNSTTLDDLTGEGEIVIPRVDHFSVMLGTAQDGMKADCSDVAGASDVAVDGNLDCFGYIRIPDYLALSATNKPQIVSVKIGLLVRSLNASGKNKFFNKDQEYQILQTKAKLNESERNNLYLRNVITQTIALRNGFGVRN